MTLYPLKFRPYLMPFVWGGDKIAPYKGIECDRKDIGESWEISAWSGVETVVAEGPLEGKTLKELVSEFKGDLVGRHIYARHGDTFPLLIKFIDAARDLSIQVHPDDALAAKFSPGLNGKTEMWYVIDAAPGAHLLSGLSKPVTPDEYEELVRTDRICEVLNDVPIKPGDVFFIPAGRIHAICSGAFVAEIQQTSDLTYRIYDYGRLGLDGKPRALHIKEARMAVDFTPVTDPRTHVEELPERENILVECPYFTTSSFNLTKPLRKSLTDIDSFYAVICIDGSVSIEMESVSGERFASHLRRGESVLLPATAKGVKFNPEGTVRFLTSYIG